MLFDPANKIVVLCAQGMDFEAQGKNAEALQLFQQAWCEAENDFEKFIAAHYLARQQSTVEDKLRWDEEALRHALAIDGEEVRGVYPSLYLNIAKCYEDMQQADKAHEYYLLANLYVGYLPDDGYGNMIKAGIVQGMQRIGL